MRKVNSRQYHYTVFNSVNCKNTSDKPSVLLLYTEGHEKEPTYFCL